MKVVIAGLGKSGTTALFFKLRGALPPSTCCLFEPYYFEAAAARGPDVLAKILINKPSINVASFRAFDKKIAIVRDPRDLLISHVLYRAYNWPQFVWQESKVSAFIAALRRKEDDPKSISVRALIDIFSELVSRDTLSPLTQTAKMALQFHRVHSDYFIYRYEDLIEARFGALARYLGLDLREELAVVPRPLQRVTRTKWAGDWRNWFVAEDVDYFRSYFLAYMRHFDYDDEWTLADEPHIQPLHASEYVRHIVEERRALGREVRQAETGTHLMQSGSIQRR